jgi:hypothetical protein
MLVFIVEKLIPYIPHSVWHTLLIRAAFKYATPEEQNGMEFLNTSIGEMFDRADKKYERNK